MNSREAEALLASPTTDARIEFLNSLYYIAESEKRLQSVDKSWDAMHRVLCGGWLDHKHGDETLRACVIGGQQLSDNPSWIISYVDLAMAKRIAPAIADIQYGWFREQYFALNRNPRGWFVHRYDYPMSEEDFEYTWEYFTFVQAFYRDAAHRNLSSVFAVDQ